jgi:hypothetical protein
MLIDMRISITEFIYSVAALRTHDEIVQPKQKVEPWLWAHYYFDNDGAHFLATGEEPPHQPVSGAIQ